MTHVQYIHHPTPFYKEDWAIIIAQILFKLLDMKGDKVSDWLYVCRYVMFRCHLAMSISLSHGLPSPFLIMYCLRGVDVILIQRI